MNAWTKLPALDGRANPCLCCPPIPAVATMDMIIAVGLGDAHAERDGEEVYREPSAYHGTKWCDACEFSGYTDEARSVVCGTCGGEGRVDDADAGEAEYWDFAEVEKLAAADPDHDWRVVMFGPLHGEEYQRHGPDQWVLVVKNEGFV